MVASAVFITDLAGKAIISRNYRGDIPLTTSIERFQKYLAEVNEESKKPVFHIDANGDLVLDEDVGTTGPGGNSYVYCQVCNYSVEILIIPTQLDRCRQRQIGPFEWNICCIHP
jgi:hypothetical protein